MGDVMNLGRLLSDTARRLPDRPALVWRDKTWTWREIDTRVNALTAALKSLGVGKGDRVLVQARNGNQMFETCWAAFKLGAVWVPTNYRLTPPEIAWLGQSSGARAFIYDRGFAEHVDAVKAASPALKQIIAIERPREGELGYENLVKQHLGAPAWEEDVSHDDPVWFLFTSGTTGKPKAAVLTHGQMTYV
ncbi:MAG: AMP-binding protein, partial [Pseudomonadota bacterium]